MITIILTALYFFLPAYIANMAPVFAAALHLPCGQPISEKLFGPHKTYRGLVAGYIGALCMMFLQQYFQSEGILETYRLLDYESLNLFLFAFLFGIGAEVGDLCKSFFKRRLGKPAGAPWFPFDQLDFVIGALLFLLPFYRLSWEYVLVLLIITPLLHFLTNVCSYALGLKKVWW